MPCRKCGKENPEGAERCESCGEKLATQKHGAVSGAAPLPMGPISVKGILCVLIVVAIAVAVLSAAFDKAHEMARKSTCQNNMKCLALSWNEYQYDWDNTYPSSAAGPYGKRWSEAADQIFRKKFGYPTAKRAKGQFLGTWPEILYGVMHNSNVCFCPSDHSNTTHDPNGDISYVVKKAFHMAWWGKGAIFDPARKEGDFEYPADQILLYERRGWHWDQAREGDMSAGSGVSGVTLNAAFMDGHVITIVIPSDIPGEPAGRKTLIEPDFYNTVADIGLYGDAPGIAKRVTRPGATNPRFYSDTLDRLPVARSQR